MIFFDLIPKEVIEVAITAISTFLIYGFHKITKYFQEKTKNEKQKIALEIIDKLIEGTVKQTEQTLVPDLKQSNANGKMTPNEMRNVLKSVIDKVLLNVDKKIKKEVLKVIPDIQTYIQTKIEETIYNMKTSDVATAPEVTFRAIDERFDSVKKPLPKELINNFKLGK